MRDQGPVIKRFGRSAGALGAIIRDVGTARRAISPTWSQPVERLTLATPPPASLQPGGVPFLGNQWDDVFKPVLSEHRENTMRLALRFGELARTLPVLDELLARGEAEATLAATRLTTQAVTDIRDASEFRPDVAGRELRPEDREAAPQNRSFNFMAWNFRQAALDVTEKLTIPIAQADARPALDLATLAASVRKSLGPYITVAERANRVIQFPPSLKLPPFDPLEIIMAHPRFDDATYEHLKKISEEYLVPNLDTIPNNTITPCSR